MCTGDAFSVPFILSWTEWFLGRQKFTVVTFTITIFFGDWLNCLATLSQQIRKKNRTWSQQLSSFWGRLHVIASSSHFSLVHWIFCLGSQLNRAWQRPHSMLSRQNQWWREWSYVFSRVIRLLLIVALSYDWLTALRDFPSTVSLTIESTFSL